MPNWQEATSWQFLKSGGLLNKNSCGDAVQYTVQQLPTKEVIYLLLPGYNNNHYHTLSMSSGKKYN
ncbi:hypothetical protein P5673_003110 [Acropora cervicornis]|uniref:Uncharacterized protein n=1 Tax=Acropora cervicornis TaxID=6130 RepID=A0AAD9R260_ACRCE|nr:hypothetical protein P5673_003110 [Acropora cervicornis]